MRLGSQTLVEPVPAWNVQSHLQVGSVLYSVSRRGEKILVQRRRQDRLQRLCYQGVSQRPEEVRQSSSTPGGMNTLPNSPIKAAEMRSR